MAGLSTDFGVVMFVTLKCKMNGGVAIVGIYTLTTVHVGCHTYYTMVQQMTFNDW
jgi:hypothetical protein